MPTLQCSANNCAYNSNQRCSLQQIDVTGIVSASTSEETSCQSFVNRLEGEASNVVGETYASPQTNIHCRADSCMYNMKGNCTSDTIEITGEGASSRDETGCSTFSDGANPSMNP